MVVVEDDVGRQQDQQLYLPNLHIQQSTKVFFVIERKKVLVRPVHMVNVIDPGCHVI